MAKGDVVTTHTMVNANPDDATDKMKGFTLPSDWNAEHTLEGMAEFQLAVKGGVSIDMGGVNYTMTLNESIAPVKIILNSGVGTTLTYHADTFSYIASAQRIISSFTAKDYTLDNGNGNTIALMAGYSEDLIVLSTSIISQTQQAGKYARELSTEVIKLSSAALEATPEVGAIEYLTNTAYLTPSASSRGILIAEHFSLNQSDKTLTDGNAAQSFLTAGATTLTAVANTTYKFQAQVFITNGTASHNLSFSLLGTATYGWVAYNASGRLKTANSAANLVGGWGYTNAAQVISGLTTQAGRSVLIEGHFVVTTAGTVIPSITFGAAPGGTNLAKAGSYFRCHPVGSNTAATVGNWA